MPSENVNPYARGRMQGVSEQSPQVRQTMYGLRDELKKYQPGDRFLSRQEVKRQYAVSDSVAKVALRLLVEAQLLEARQGRGYVVLAHPES